MKRQAEITVQIGCPIELVRFHSQERLGELFEITADVIVADKVDFLPSLGKPAMIELFEAQQSVRFFHALLSEAHFRAEDNAGYHYSLVLRPWFRALAYNRSYRVFENCSALEIIKEILSPYSAHADFDRITGSYQRRPYTTQYRESDFAFLSRIMEREGLYYYFEHRRDAHVLVLCDAPAAHAPPARYSAVKLRSDRAGGNGGLTDALWRWHEHVRDDGEHRFLFRSFDYQSSSVKQGQAVGAVRNPADRQEVYHYSGDFVSEPLAAHWARVGMEAARARQRFYSGEGDAIGLSCGSRFRLDSEDAFGRGQEFIVTALDVKVEAEPFRTGAEALPRHVAIEAVASDTQWRSSITTEAPRAGPETAIVIAGGADDTNADPAGRVRVRFLWGRGTDAPERTRSCWLRVSTASAGASFGHVALPRLQEEVVVDFLDGNPDRPIVTGRVYNSEHPHPYALPQHRTRSVYRSQTIGRPGSYAGAERQPPAGAGFNELHFEDKGGAEQVYLRAQRDRVADIFLDDEARIGRDSKVRVGRDRKTEIRRDETIKVETGDYRLGVERGRASVTATQAIHLAVGTSTLSVDPMAITLRVGVNTIILSQAGIVFNGLTITSSALTTQTINGALTTVTAQGLLSLIGKPPVIA